MADNGFTTPTLAELVESTSDDLNANLDGEDARLRGSEPYAIARTMAAVAKGFYGFLVFLANQILPDTAVTTYLERWASVFGITRLQADQSIGSIQATGNDGTTIPLGTEWSSLDGEIVWVTTADATIAGGVATCAVQAAAAARGSDASPGTIAVLVQPIAGVDSEGTTNDISGGDDRETDEDLRERLVERIQDPPQGGAEADYVAWVRESGDVDRVFVTPNQTGGGTVGIRFTKNVPEGGTAEDAIPDPGDVAQAQFVVDANRPVTADATVYELTPLDVDFDIEVHPDTTQVRLNVEAELNALFIRTAEPGGTVYLSQIGEAISAAEGEEWHVLNDPVADVAIGANEFPVVGTITWS